MKENAYRDDLLHAHLVEQKTNESAQEWINERACELLTEPNTVCDIADNYLIHDDDNYEHLIPELLRDMVLLHSKHPSDLSGSDLLVRLYKTAQRLHEQAIEFATWQAEEDFETMVKEDEDARADMMMSNWELFNFQHDQNQIRKQIYYKKLLHYYGGTFPMEHTRRVNRGLEAQRKLRAYWREKERLRIQFNDSILPANVIPFKRMKANESS